MGTRDQENRRPDRLGPGPFPLRIRRAVTVTVPCGLAVRRRDHVDVGIVRAVVRKARAHLEERRVRIRAVLQVMPVAVAGLEPRAIAGAQGLGSASVTSVSSPDKM